jgi:hypothetical protein
MADLPIPQFELFQPSAPPSELIPRTLDAALTMLLRELMLSVVDDAGGEKADE